MVRYFLVIVVAFVFLLAPFRVSAQTPTDTDTPTATDTPTPGTDTPTPTPTPTLTNTPNVVFVVTMESGQQGEVIYTVTAGEAGIMSIQLVILGVLIFGVVILVRRK